MTDRDRPKVLTDEQWKVLAPLIEASRPPYKTDHHDLRRTIEAIIWRHEQRARVLGRGVAAVGKWPAGATIRGRAQAGHLSTAGVARAGGHRRSPAMVRVASLSPQQG